MRLADTHSALTFTIAMRLPEPEAEALQTLMIDCAKAGPASLAAAVRGFADHIESTQGEGVRLVTSREEGRS